MKNQETKEYNLRLYFKLDKILPPLLLRRKVGKNRIRGEKSSDSRVIQWRRLCKQTPCIYSKDCGAFCQSWQPALFHLASEALRECDMVRDLRLLEMVGNRPLTSKSQRQTHTKKAKSANCLPGQTGRRVSRCVFQAPPVAAQNSISVSPPVPGSSQQSCLQAKARDLRGEPGTSSQVPRTEVSSHMYTGRQVCVCLRSLFPSSNERLIAEGAHKGK